jgi:hypothetical protein
LLHGVSTKHFRPIVIRQRRLEGNTVADCAVCGKVGYLRLQHLRGRIRVVLCRNVRHVGSSEQHARMTTDCGKSMFSSQALAWVMRANIQSVAKVPCL